MDLIAGIELTSHVAAIATAILAAWAWLVFVRAGWKRRQKLEEHLRAEKVAGLDQGQRTVLSLMADLGMTETQVLDAAFSSKNVRRRVQTDAENKARTLLLEYTTGDEEEDLKLTGNIRKGKARF